MFRGLLTSGFCLILLLLYPSLGYCFEHEIKKSDDDLLVLQSSAKKANLYPFLYILEDREKALTIDDVVFGEYADKFVHAEQYQQKSGFFATAKWLRIDVHNESGQEDWLLEFAFSLIDYIKIFSLDGSRLIELEEGGSMFEFGHRKINHRNFIFHLEIDPNQTKTYYILVHAQGDAHPPIHIWNPEDFYVKSQFEFILLGIFYGVASVMVLYNLFLYFSLRMRSYLYYVLATTCAIIANLQNNGLGYQYMWPHSSVWNEMANPIFVSLACVFILMFVRSFLETDRYFPNFKWIAYGLMIFNGMVIGLLIFYERSFALNVMLFSTSSTFIAVLSAAILCLLRGARQARFFIAGWSIYLIGITITIFATGSLLPYTSVAPYAAQIALGIEIVLLSLALADKINIMRAEKEKAEKEARESQALALESLENVNKLKDEFLAVTSHELRTPLNGIIGIAETLRDGAAGQVPENVRNQLSMIVTSGKRLANLVNEILEFVKLKNHELKIAEKPVNLYDITNVVLTICQSLVKGKPVRLLNKISPSTPLVYADENRLQQILYNLVGNAIKYTEAGEIAISSEQTVDFLKIIVSDTGTGIPLGEQKRIFEPFYQGSLAETSDYSGSGIGLSVTKRLVELHGGQLFLKSKVGEGTEISFTLPYAAGEEAALASDRAAAAAPFIYEPISQEVRTAEAASPPTKSGKILIADDEPVNLQVLKNQLALEGYEVIAVDDGEKAVEYFRHEAYDLLILDIMMPKMSGFEVCQHVRMKFSLMELPIIMLTAKNQVQDITASFEVGANDYLTKPCDKEELLARVKTLVRLRSLNAELLAMNQQLEKKVQERTQALVSANQELKKMNEELVAMTKSRRLLLANIAHELSNPVTFIYAYLQALQNGDILTDDSFYRNLVVDKIKVLNRLIDDLSDLSKLEAGQTNFEFRLAELDSWVKELKKNIEFSVTRGNRTYKEKIKNFQALKSYLCLIDIERMDQVFLNLIHNAIKHTSSADGTITFAAEVDETAREIIFQIQDNGSGIKKENLPHIFERFYRVDASDIKSEDTGTGLGLAIVKEIVNSHKGKIWVESKFQKGTTFYISLSIMKR